MLQYEDAKRLYQEITEKAATTRTEGFDELYEFFIWYTLVYANTLTVWAQMDIEEKISYQAKRKDEFFEYSVWLQKVCIELDIDVLDNILADEDEQSDFACYVQLFISLANQND